MAWRLQVCSGQPGGAQGKTSTNTNNAFTHARTHARAHKHTPHTWVCTARQAARKACGNRACGGQKLLCSLDPTRVYLHLCNMWTGMQKLLVRTGGGARGERQRGWRWRCYGSADGRFRGLRGRQVRVRWLLSRRCFQVCAACTRSHGCMHVRAHTRIDTREPL